MVLIERYLSSQQDYIFIIHNVFVFYFEKEEEANEEEEEPKMGKDLCLALRCFQRVRR